MLRLGLSLRATVFLVITLAVVGPVVAWWWAERQSLRKTYEPLVAQNHQAVLGLAAAALIEPLWTIDEAATDAAVERVMSDPTVLQVRLTEQRPAADSGPIVRERRRPSSEPRLERAVHRHIALLREGQALGTLEMWFDPDTLDELLDRRRAEAFWLALMQMAVAGTVLSLVFYRRLLAPIGRLKSQATQMAFRGDFTAQNWNSHDELGQLGQHLNAVHEQVHALFTQLEQQRAELEKFALHDSLTGLPNRRLFHELLHSAIASAHRQGGALALLFIDLDRFKSVNDSFGHAAGDELLIAVAQRLRHAVRSSDTVSRYSGDEFLVLLPDAGSETQLAAKLEQLQQALSAPLSPGGREVQVSSSLGVALYPQDASTPEELIRHADLAMYEAKQLGRGHHSFFCQALNTRAQHQLQLEQELRQALLRHELLLHYQPQVDARDGRLVGCEALIRWVHPARGMVPPLEFIPLAEQCGLIGAIGSRTVELACRQIAHWKQEGFAFGRVAVNLSAVEFRDRGLAEHIGSILREWEVQGTELEIEVTETALMNDHDLTRQQLNQLRALGIELAVDDFGTGYSSLAYLKRLHPRTVKIDRSFVASLPGDQEDLLVVKAIIQLARSLGIAVVAEGVETEAQRRLLQEAGCDLLQGYWIGRPCDPAGLRDWARLYRGVGQEQATG